ncbi:protein O-mannosyl-transferase 2-like [Mytilus californianus]|uniref:protein O-mannosyl-transferase 2-like n=1 Tax=Mytilus californianus TaxID=6549 RepID=UPI00224834EC|nr:protein O-mannosyl-transferase 2-like [Mytilus californianus]
MSSDGLRKRKEEACSDRYISTKKNEQSIIYSKETTKTNAKNVDNRKTEDENESFRSTERMYFLLLSLFTIFSIITRFYNIENPTHVCWDETHFGKMGSWYIKRTFFFDVHPPLGKMLIALSGVLTGYDGEFPFAKPGDEYGDTNYIGMRMFCALLGGSLVPLSYMSVWLLTESLLASSLSATLILLDVGTLTLSRHILLDPILLFFIMMSVYCLLKFSSYRQESFSIYWWFWLAQTGIFLAFSIGVKFVGLFIILFAGYSTAADLWCLVGEKCLNMVLIVKHFLARVLCLIILPAIVYMMVFAVHLKILNHSGSGDGFYSSGFQSQLMGNRLYNVSMPENIAYGSEFTLKQRRTGGAYLHSHWHLYPEEHPPQQQQVTTYAHKDENNKWIIKPADTQWTKTDSPALVKSGDLVRLEHIVTQRLLHSHREPAPLTKRHYQVAGYGVNGSGDANDVWILEVVGGSTGAVVQTVRSHVRLIHYHVRCALQSHDKKLPKWGWEQLEVTCNPNIKDKKTLWSVEEVTDQRLPNASFELYSPSFLERFIESHAVMTQGNSGLKPKEGEITSRPWQWPINYRGQMFSGKDHRIYLLGNPVIFWGCLGLTFVFIIAYSIDTVKSRRGLKNNKYWRAYKDRMFSAGWWLFLGWMLHYFPFWPMTRVLYFHHYFPAFLFSAMLSGVVLDYILTCCCITVPEQFSLIVFQGCIAAIFAVLFWSFYLFYPLSYGMSGPSSMEEGSPWRNIKWMESWDL